MLTIDDMIDRFDGSIGYATNSKEICQYIADLLKELKERRNEPELVHCGECGLYYLVPSGRRRCSLHCTYTKPDDFCSLAERRTDG